MVSSEDDIRTLLTLMNADRKSSLRKLCQESIVTRSAFADVILAGMLGALPWNHKRCHREFMPEELVLGDDDLKALGTARVGPAEGKALKAITKINQTYVQRRLLSGHLFFTDDLKNWHLFYFDRRDLDGWKNHWAHGSHVHLINFLWPQHTAPSVWEAFNAGTKMTGAFHVRYDNEMPKGGQSR